MGAPFPPPEAERLDVSQRLGKSRPEATMRGLRHPVPCTCGGVTQPLPGSETKHLVLLWHKELLGLRSPNLGKVEGSSSSRTRGHPNPGHAWPGLRASPSRGVLQWGWGMLTWAGGHGSEDAPGAAGGGGKVPVR